MGAQDILLALMRFGILGAVSAPFVVLFRRAGLPGGWPGAAIGAGILVGLLAGPAGLWKTAPDWWRRDPGPDAAAVEALARQQSLDGAEVAALQATGVSPEGVLEHDAALHRRRQPLADLVQASSESRFRALRAAEGAALLLFAGPMILLGAGAGLAHSHGKSASGTLGNGKGRGMGIGMGTGMVIGCFALVFGALLNALLLALVLHFTPRQALAIGAALAGGSAWFALPTGRANADAFRPWPAAWMATAMAGGLLGVLAAPGVDHGWVCLSLAGCVLGAMVCRGRMPVLRRFAWPVVHVFVVPGLAAHATTLVEPDLLAGGRPLAYLAVAVAAVGCGHLLGTVLGAAVVRPAGVPAWRAWISGLELGMPASAILAAGAMVAAGAVDPRAALGAAVVAGAVLGALVCAVAAPMLRDMSRAARPG